MTTPSDREAEIEAVADALAYPRTVEDVHIDRARTAIAVLDSYRAENKVVPPYMRSLDDRIIKFVHHQPRTGKYRSEFQETYAFDTPLTECGWACCAENKTEQS